MHCEIFSSSFLVQSLTEFQPLLKSFPPKLGNGNLMLLSICWTQVQAWQLASLSGVSGTVNDCLAVHGLLCSVYSKIALFPEIMRATSVFLKSGLACSWISIYNWSRWLLRCLLFLPRYAKSVLSLLSARKRGTSMEFSQTALFWVIAYKLLVGCYRQLISNCCFQSSTSTHVNRWC